MRKAFWVGGAVVLAILGGLLALQVPQSHLPRQISDANGIVTLYLPTGWLNKTSPNARSLEFGSSDSEPYQVRDVTVNSADLELNNTELALIDVTISLRRDLSLAEEHAWTLKHYASGVNFNPTQTQGGSATSLGTLTGGDESVTDAIVVARTVQSRYYLVTIYGQTSLRSDLDGQRLTDIIEKIEVH